MLRHRHVTHRRARLALGAVLAVPSAVVLTLGAPSGVVHALTAPQLVADVNTDGEGSEPAGFTLVDSRLFFTADDGIHGRELWMSDDGAAPVMVADVNPSGASNPSGLFATNTGILYFAATDGASGAELWRSDGTDTGTYRVADINVGPSSSSPKGFVTYAGFTYFNATTYGSGSTGSELWRTDGTAAGTTLAADLDPGPGSSDPQDLTVVDHGAGDRRLWMRADASGSYNDELVVYDAPEGTTADPPVVLFHEGNPTELTAFAGDLYAVTGVSPNRALQRVERTAVGPPATYAATSLGGKSPNQLVTMSGDLYLSNGATTSSDQELHVLDGNTLELVKDINTGSSGSSPNDAVATGGFLYFAASDGTAHSEELWRSDGTEAGTVLVADIAAGGVPSHPVPVAAKAGAVFFTAHDQVSGRELWFARASDDAVFQVEDLFPGSNWSSLSDGVLAGDHLYIGGDDRAHGDEPMRVDVAAPLVEGATDIELFADIAAGTAGSEPYHPAAVGDRVMFTAETFDLGHEPWLFDPGLASAALLADLEVGNVGSWPGEATSLGQRTLMSASVGGDTELWVTDGTAGGTSMIEIDPGSEARPNDFVRAGDYVYFSAEHTATGRELWRTDGTAAGTVLLLDAVAGPVSGDPEHLTAFGGRLLFAVDGTLWISDGALTGTMPLIAGADAPAGVREIAAADDWAVFAAESPNSATDDVLWVTDGTPAGTFPIETTPTANPRYPYDLSMSGDVAYFSAYDGSNLRAWATDGTADGTHPVTIAPAEPNGDEYGATAGGGAVFGVYADSGYELWVSDGSLAGTHEVVIPDGPVTELPYEFTSHNGWAYFGLAEPVHGHELWRTNGITTERVTDLAPGPADGLPRGDARIEAVGNDLYFVGDDTTTGDELWVIADVPRAPLGVTATAGVGSATVSWSPPGASALAPITGYTATAAPGGTTCTSAVTTCSVVGLSSGTSYTFTVVAHSAAGSSAPSAPSNAVVPTAPGVVVSPVTPIEPARFLDTRAGPTFDGQQAGVGRLSPGAVFRVPVAGRGSVPAGATGVVANLTVVSPDAPGHATLFPCTPQPPNASHLNYLPGDVLADNAVVPLDAGGGVCIYTRAAADYVLDVNGFVGAGSPLVGVEPARYLATRSEPKATTFDGTHRGGGAVPAEQVVEVAIAGRGAVPNGATAAFVTVTAVAPDGPGYLTLYPCDTRPHASNLNYAAGEVVPNGAVVELSPTGTLCVFTKATAHVLVDVTGYLPDGATGLTAAAPQRLLDTRPGGPTVDGGNSGSPGRLVADQIVEIQVAGRGTIPAGATAALLNIGLVAPSAPGYATLYTCGPRPIASNVNAIAPGSVRANNALTQLSPTGTVCVYVKAATDVILDATGWIAPPLPPSPTPPTTPPPTTDPLAACARSTSLPQPGDTSVDLVLTGRVLGPDGQPVDDGGGFVRVVDRRSSVGARLGEAGVNDAGFFLAIIGSNAVPADTNCRDYWLEVCAPGGCGADPAAAALATELDVTALIGEATGRGRQEVDISDDELTYSRVE